MTDQDSTSNSTTSMSTAARISWGALIVVTLAVCYFSNLGVIGFVGPDEPRYAWIARDMAETGDWVTPRLYGRPWFEKPPLFYWMAGASFKLFGVSEAAARLPSALCALFATLALAWLAWRAYGAETARWLLLLLPTSVGMIGFSHAAATDMPFSAMLTIAMVCAAVVLGLVRNEQTPILPHTPWIALLLFGFFLGLAVLAKGPAAIILSGGAVFFWVFFTKKWRDAFRLLHPVAIVSFCATALPWYILCARRNPDFFRVFIIEHNFKRYLTPEFQHIQPFWYYVLVVLVAFLPWTAALLWSIPIGAHRLYKTRSLSPTSAFLFTWAIFCVLFFSISRSKLPGYVLPSFPAIGLLLSQQSRTSISKQSFAVVLIAFGCIFLFALFPIQFASHETSKFRPDVAPAYSTILLAIAAANLLAGFACLIRNDSRIRGAALTCSVIFAVLPLFFARMIVPHLFLRDPSARSLARELVAQQIPPGRLAFRSGKRDFKYALSFYLHREIKDWNGATTGETFVLANSGGCKAVELAGSSCMEVTLGPNVNGWSLSAIKPNSSPDGLAGGGKPR